MNPRLLAYLLSLAFLTSPQNALYAEGTTAPPSPELSLSGIWKFAVDKSGVDESATYASPTFNDTGWTTQSVPGKWVRQGFPNYQGKGWYRKTFAIPESWQGKSLFLQLPPADQSDRTYVNGTLVGELKNKPTLPRVYPLPPDLIKWGGDNVVAVEVTSKVGNGGFGFGPARILQAGPFVPQPRPSGPSQNLSLQATANLSEILSGDLNWKNGWFDPGTSNTRMIRSVEAGILDADQALGLEVRFPNSSGEFIDFRLPSEITGTVWRERGDDFLKFSYQTDSLDGEMRMHLNAGNFKFGTGGGGWSTTFQVRPGGWTEVTLPMAEFAKRTQKSMAFMPDTGAVQAMSLGYNNNTLRGPGKIRFSNFEVGRFASGSPTIVPLDGLWSFAPDPDATGLAQGWAKSDFDTSSWATLLPGRPWQAQGFKTYGGAGWMRQKVWIPAEWSGLPLRLRAGQVLNFQDDGELFVNGELISRTTKWDKDIDAKLLPEIVQPGSLNSISIHINGVGKTNSNGLEGGPFVLEPMPVWLELRAAGSSESFVPPQKFDPGTHVGKALELSLRVPKLALPKDAQSLTYELVDCFFRVIAEGTVSLKPNEGAPYLEAVVSLSAESSQRLFFSEFFDMRLQVLSSSKTVIYAATQRNIAMLYEARDNFKLPALPESREDTPYGNLKLVDVIDPALDPKDSPHPYKEGGVRGSWVGRTGYRTWENGIRIGEFAGKRYREANNNEWFGYRVGREIKPGSAYLVRIEYPEDKTRYFPVNIDAGRNYQGLGFKTGVSSENPFDNYPLSKGYSFYDVLVIPDALTYGSGGSRSVPADKGFWIFFHDIGRAFASQYDSGPAVSQIRVYEVPDISKMAPSIRYPEGLPRRTFVADWEREPETVPKDMVNHARFSGYNAISPETLKWGNLAFWRVKSLPFRITKPLREDLPDNELSAYEGFLEATRDSGLTLFPRLEYGGSENIPKDQRAIGKTGKPAKPNRFHVWCSDLLRPVVLEEMTVLFQDVVGGLIHDNPQIGGVLFRIRSDRLPISYSRFDVEMFAKETQSAIPDGLDDVGLAKWASSGPIGKTYTAWWHGKRRDFHKALTKVLQDIRPDLKLLYYNWDSDNWNLGKFNRNAEDYTNAYNMNTSRKAYEREAASQAAIAPERYVEMLRSSLDPDHQVWPELYADVKGFALLGPVNWRYLADNPAYINSFRTGEQLALTKIYNYEEKGRWNVQGDNYESSEMSPGGPDFAMAEQVLAVFHGDPWILTETTYTYGQGFLDAHRRFAQAFLGLPAVPGEVVEQPTGRDEPMLKVRSYLGTNARFLSVAHRGLESASFTLRLPGSWKGKEKITDLVTGESVPARMEGDRLVMEVSARPMSLQSYRIE